MKEIKKVPSIVIKREKKESADVKIPVEAPVTIFLNDEQLLTVLATPTQLKELAVGFLYGEGIINSLGDIDEVRVDDKRNEIWITLKKKTIAKELLFKKLLTSGCGRGVSLAETFKVAKITSKFRISSTICSNLMELTLVKAKIFRLSGGIHCASLADKQGVIAFAEDIGRHNAVDKVLGECFLSQMTMKNKVIVTTGRISSEMLLKAARARVPVILSRSSPTSMSIELAGKLGVTLVGYVRAGRLNIYTYPSRITF